MDVPADVVTDAPPEEVAIPALLLSDRPAAYRPTEPPKRPREIDSRVVFIAAGAIVVVLAVVGVALLLNSGGQPSHQAGGTHATTTTTPSPPPTADTRPPSASTVNTPPQVGSAPTSGTIGYSAAGGTVVAYFGNFGSPGYRFSLLTPGAQAAFGGLTGFENYWSQFTQLSSAHAIGVTLNSDGSVNVPIDVTYTTGTGPGASTQTQQRIVRVVQENGKLLIDALAK
jgi:hypothetical protein